MNSVESHDQKNVMKNSHNLNAVRSGAKTTASILLGFCLPLAALSNTWSQTTYSWQAASSSPITDLGNWTPTPPNLATLSANSIVFGMDAATNINAQVTGTFNINNVEFSRPTGQTSILGNGSTATLAVAGNLTNSSGTQFILRQNSGNTLSVTVDGNMNLNSGLTRFGVNTSAGNNSQISNVSVVGTTNLAGTLTFGTIITGSTVNLGNVVMAGGTLNPISGTNLDINNGTANNTTNTINMNRLHGSGTIQGAKDGATLATTGVIAVNGTVDGTFSGTISNGLTNNVLALTKDGSSTLTLTGANSYTGSTVINGGTLLISGATGASSGTSAITVNNGGTFSYSSAVGLNRNITLNTGGTFSHTGADPYTGTLTWNGGTLAGTNFSGVTLSVGANKTLSPGNSPGTMQTASQTWTDGGNYNLQIFDFDLAPGTGFDTIAITGTLNLGGLTAGGFNINLWSLSEVVPDVNGNALNFNNAVSDSWMILSTTGGISGFDAQNFTINVGAFNNTAGFSNPLGGGTFSVSQVGHNLFLNFTAIPIPEPSSWALLTVGLCAVTLLRRRRKF